MKTLQIVADNSVNLVLNNFTLWDFEYNVFKDENDVEPVNKTTAIFMTFKNGENKFTLMNGKSICFN